MTFEIIRFDFCRVGELGGRRSTKGALGWLRSPLLTQVESVHSWLVQAASVFEVSECVSAGSGPKGNDAAFAASLQKAPMGSRSGDVAVLSTRQSASEASGLRKKERSRSYQG